ncbi:molybdopterin converting factor subunit 1 [Hasllibacter sp. MH4015]|uniref:molybdopterin converting factor subunit 1 n=1 Tax=Hasllibacter sp. MH4015 TaxID=2854029 RepID=UPI001CD30081|nr:molybdopterin converting factor subunit 1 [Hasllibacter sp. MH4015]
MELRYFAWLRERIGTGHEVVETDAPTVSALIEELKTRSDAHAYAFSDLKAIRAAVDQELVDLDTPLREAREVAFFPPMTGG